MVEIQIPRASLSRSYDAWVGSSLCFKKNAIFICQDFIEKRHAVVLIFLR